MEQYENILDAVAKKHNIDIIMLDYAKAFDTINHSILLHKLKNFGIGGKVGKWISNFLLNRNQQVAINGFQSEPSQVISGVPQGTILGPVLFLIYIADITDKITHSKVASYADDSKVSKEIETEKDCESLQADTNKLYRWTSDNLMEFNTTKFAVLKIGPNCDLKTIKYTNPVGEEIPEIDIAKDLGVYFNSSGDFTDHIKIKVSKSKQIRGYIMRTFLSRKPEIMITLLKSLVLPIIDYSSVVWNPHTFQDIATIESVQRNYTSKLEGMSDINYYQRLKSLKLYSSERRRTATIYCTSLKSSIVKSQTQELVLNGLLDEEKFSPTPQLDVNHQKQLLFCTTVLPGEPLGCLMLFHNICETSQPTLPQTL